MLWQNAQIDVVIEASEDRAVVFQTWWQRVPYSDIRPASLLAVA
jgi:hypothetical protein